MLNDNPEQNGSTEVPEPSQSGSDSVPQRDTNVEHVRSGNSESTITKESK